MYITLMFVHVGALLHFYVQPCTMQLQKGIFLVMFFHVYSKRVLEWACETFNKPVKRLARRNTNRDAQNRVLSFWYSIKFPLFWLCSARGAAGCDELARCRELCFQVYNCSLYSSRKLGSAGLELIHISRSTRLEFLDILCLIRPSFVLCVPAEKTAAL
jgi:hypothetical protein